MELPCSSEITIQNSMLPPSPGTFQNREDLINYVRDFGVSQGYVVTIRKSKKDRRVILGCDRGGTYRSRRSNEELKRKRKANSRLINCPFEAIGKKDDDEWVLIIKNGEHNHEPLKDMSEHRYSQRFSEEEVKQIKLMSEAGIRPSEMLKALKENNPDLHSTLRHLYNVKAKLRQGLTEKSFKSWRPNLSATVSASTETSTSSFPLKVSNYICGEFLDSEAREVVDVINPATQEVGSQVPITTHTEFKDAVVAAKQAFPAWKNTPVATRQRIMFKLQELIRRDIDKISMNIVAEQGMTLNCAKADVLHGLEFVESACGITTLLKGNYVTNAATGIDTLCSREPLGVCAGICISDFSPMIPLCMFPIAITCGNTFILKPSEKNPGVSAMIAALAAEAGVPDGVLNIIHGNHEIAKYICDDEDIIAISITCSNSVGLDIYARAAARGKRIQSSIQVKNHIVIMPDASVDAALDAILASAFGAAGKQRIMAPNIAVFVGDSTQWEKEIVERAKKLKVNAGTVPGTDIGPVISKEAKDSICRLVQSGISSGARLVLDGRHIVVPRYEQGNFVGPTILCDITTSMDCYKEHVAGPVLLCMQAENLEEAITIVNSSKLRNGACIFTSSCDAARKFQNEVETSLVGINVPVPRSSPFSTYNASNIAGDINFCGKEDVNFCTQLKTVVQQWKELPRRRGPLHHPPTFDTEMSCQRVSIAAAMPSSDNSGLPYDNVSPSFPPSAEEDSPIPGPLQACESIMSTPSTSKPDPSADRGVYTPLESDMIDLVAETPYVPPTNDSMDMLPVSHNDPPISASAPLHENKDGASPSRMLIPSTSQEI